jgi:hypothetical protein
MRAQRAPAASGAKLAGKKAPQCGCLWLIRSVSPNRLLWPADRGVRIAQIFFPPRQLSLIRQIGFWTEQFYAMTTIE